MVGATDVPSAIRVEGSVAATKIIFLVLTDLRARASQGYCERNPMTSPVRTKPWNFGSTLSTAEIGEREREYVLRVLDKRRLFRYFPDGLENSEAARLESMYADRLGVRHSLAVNGGTSALVCALVGARVGAGDEVIVPGYTYIATAAAVLMARAVPVIVEVDDTLTMDPAAFEAAITPHTKAVIPVHMRGVPSQLDEIMSVARRHQLVVIEDVAQANGGSYKGQELGSIGDAGCFSFQQYKLITAGEGGMVVTDDEDIYTRAAIYHDAAFAFWITSQKADRAPYSVFPGENYRMSEINAALALAQSERIDSLLARLRRIKSSIVEGIADVEQIQLQRIPDPDGDVSYSLIFYLPNSASAGHFSDLLRAEGIPNGTINRDGFPDRHIFRNWDYVLNKRGVTENDTPWNCSSYKGTASYSPDMCPNTLDWLSRAISIGLHQNMADEDCADVVEAIRKVAAKF